MQTVTRHFPPLGMKITKKNPTKRLKIKVKLQNDKIVSYKTLPKKLKIEKLELIMYSESAHMYQWHFVDSRLGGVAVFF